MFKDIVGQKLITKELTAIVKTINKQRTPVNIMLRGPAGSGKTYIAEEVLVEICGGEFTRQLPANSRNKFIFPQYAEKYFGHFVDEVHTIKNVEAMYPILDSNKYVFVLASNEAGILPEALTSRCFVYSLEPYSVEEIAQIIMIHGRKIKFRITYETALLIAEKSRLSPRIGEQYLDRIRFMISAGQYRKTVRGINAAFKDVGIYKGGYTVYDIRYLQLLNELGRASLDTLSKTLKIDKSTIQNEIEPFLLDKGHIEIGRGGRKIISWEQNQL